MSSSSNDFCNFSLFHQHHFQATALPEFCWLFLAGHYSQVNIFYRQSACTSADRCFLCFLPPFYSIHVIRSLLWRFPSGDDSGNGSPVEFGLGNIKDQKSAKYAINGGVGKGKCKKKDSFLKTNPNFYILLNNKLLQQPLAFFSFTATPMMQGGYQVKSPMSHDHFDRMSHCSKR